MEVPHPTGTVETVGETFCRWCDQPMHPWLRVPGDWRRPAIRVEYACYWCDACHYGELQPRPPLEDITDSYAVPYYTHEPDPGAAGGGAASFCDRLCQHLAWRRDQGQYLTVDVVRALVAPPARICELGCGHGGFAQQLQQAGYKVIGFDPDPKARSAAAKKGITVFVGYAETLPPALEPGLFDVAIMSHVLEHCQEPDIALQNVFSLLRPGGYLLCEVPNNAAAGLRISGPVWQWLDVPRHLNFFTRPSLEAACLDAGFDIANHQYAGYYRQFTGNWIQAEQQIWHTLYADHPAPPPPPTPARTWRLLLKTFFASPASKYDSIRITARRPL